MQFEVDILKYRGILVAEICLTKTDQRRCPTHSDTRMGRACFRSLWERCLPFFHCSEQASHIVIDKLDIGISLSRTAGDALQAHDACASLARQLPGISVALRSIDDHLNLFLLHLLSQRNQMIRRRLDARLEFNNADLL